MKGRSGHAQVSCDFGTLENMFVFPTRQSLASNETDHSFEKQAKFEKISSYLSGVFEPSLNSKVLLFYHAV